jgi:hypothetical protein
VKYGDEGLHNKRPFFLPFPNLYGVLRMEKPDAYGYGGFLIGTSPPGGHVPLGSGSTR